LSQVYADLRDLSCILHSRRRSKKRRWLLLGKKEREKNKGPVSAAKHSRAHSQSYLILTMLKSSFQLVWPPADCLLKFAASADGIKCDVNAICHLHFYQYASTLLPKDSLSAVAIQRW
jgi:hypothetical protein